MTVRHGLRGQIMEAGKNTHISPEYSSRLLATMNKHKDHHGYEHARWRDININLRNTRQFFAVVRNPWARVVSRYCFAKKLIEIEKKIPPTYADVSSFEAFLEERHIWGDKEFFWHRAIRCWYPQVDHVTDEQGDLKCFIMRTEHLDEDITKYFNLSEPLKRRNVTATIVKPYPEYYNSITKNIIGDWYEKDVTFFGFNDIFSTATRNIWNHE